MNSWKSSAMVDTISWRATLQGLACCKAFVEEVVSMIMSSIARLSTELQATKAAGWICGSHT